MATLGRSPGAAPLTSADIPDNSITSAKIGVDVIVAEDIAANAITVSEIQDNAVTLAKMAGGTDGQIITYDASGDPVAVGPGSDGEVLTSTGAGSPPAFEAASSFDADAAQVFNESGADVDFRVEGAGQANALFVQGSDGKVGIGTAVPQKTLSVGDGDVQFFDSANDCILFLDQGNTIASPTKSWFIRSASSGVFTIKDVGAGVERLTINAIGNVGINSTSPSARLYVAGDVYFNNCYIGAYTGNNGLSTSSDGGGSTTMYIGNASITVSSDERIKENIVDTKIDAMEKLNALRVVDFTWNDPSDIAFNNRNARGKYTGLIAQEVVNVLPFCVNAVRDEETLTPQPNSKEPAIPDILYEEEDEIPEGKSIGDVKTEGLPERDALWGMEYQYIVPVLVKAIQELSAKVTVLESA